MHPLHSISSWAVVPAALTTTAMGQSADPAFAEPAYDEPHTIDVRLADFDRDGYLDAVATIDAQAWFRDPLAPGGSNLSAGLEWTVCP